MRRMVSGLFLSGAKSGYNAVQFNRMGQEAFDTGSYRDYILHQPVPRTGLTGGSVGPSRGW